MSGKSIPEKLIKTWSISKESSPAPVESDSKSKRIKACFHCRRAKVKCDNNNGDYSIGCKRCSKHNLECYYEYKTSKYKNVNSKLSTNEEVALSKVPKNIIGDSVETSDGSISRIIQLLSNSQSGDSKSADQIALDLVLLLQGKVELGKRRADTENGWKLKRSKSEKALKLSEIISLQECLELFTYFNKFISSQLFGFYLLKNANIRDLHEKNSLLAVTISYISSIHHLSLQMYSERLKNLFDSLIFQIVVRNESPRDDFEAFNNILSLCLTGFWLNQNFTGIAVQLAKNSGINLGRKSAVPTEDKIKLWYLLYTLDGQQALAYHREPIIMSEDFSIHRVKRKLLEEKPSSLFQDIRLVSQVEYNSIVNDMFQGRSWDVLDPSRFGIPFKTNMELDKWMVHWTVLFGSINGFDNNVWSSKSTLIYYNFAKMHVNSKFIKGLIGSNEVFLNWNYNESLEEDYSKRFKELNENSETDSTDDDEYDNNDDDNDNNDDDDNDDYSDESQFISEQDPVISSQIAIASAMNILQLFLFDNDVIDSLKFCPTHIHVLLYYAVLLSLNSPSLVVNGYSDFFKLVKLLKNLLKILSINLPIDKEFGLKLVFHIKKIMTEKLESILSSSVLEEDQRVKLMKELNGLKNNTHIEEDYDSEKEIKDKEKKISAWPGTDHSHPVVNNTKILEFSP